MGEYLGTKQEIDRNRAKLCTCCRKKRRDSYIRFCRGCAKAMFGDGRYQRWLTPRLNEMKFLYQNGLPKAYE